MPDAEGASTCNGQCAANWPPMPELTTVGDGLDEDLLGTTTRSDGKVQATYNGWPLYRFAADRAAGDTNGQGVNGIWYVVDADGDKVEKKAGQRLAVHSATEPWARRPGAGYSDSWWRIARRLAGTWSRSASFPPVAVRT